LIVKLILTLTKSKIMKVNLLFYSLLFTSVSFSQIPNYVPTTDLVSWFSFNGNTNDLSGNGNNATNSGAGLTTDRFGNANSAYSFNGSSSRIDLNLSFDHSQRSISIWLNTSALSSIIQSAFDNDYPGLTYGHTIVAVMPSTNYLLGQAGTTSCSSFTVDPDTWYSMIITRDNSTTKYYINGVLHCSMPNSTIVSSNANGQVIHFGCSRLLNRFFNGKIDDIGMWSRALTECEIQAVYNAGSSIDNTISQNGNSIVANQVGASYQWLDCNNANNPITGATNQTFTPTSGGIFAVEISLNGCSATSECLRLDFASIEEIDDNLIAIFPNPAESFVNISVENEIIGNVIITDLLGKVIHEHKSNSSSITLDLKSIHSDGTYFLNIFNDSSKLIGVKKLIIK
jgi:hypothetical protein